MGSRLALAILHSPLRVLLDPGICELAYTGRRTGRRVRLPVIYAKAGDTVAILSGASDTKTWWRNFTTPQPVWLRIRANTVTGIAVLARPGTTGFARALAIYKARFPDLSYEPGDRLIAVALEPGQEHPDHA